MPIRRICAIIGVLLLLVAAPLLGSLNLAAQSVSAMTAHYMCGGVFVQKLPASQVFDELVLPLASIFGPLLSYSVDEHSHSVTARLAGRFFVERGVWIDGFGCRLVHDPDIQSPAPGIMRSAVARDHFAQDAVIAPGDPQLRAAMDQIFSEPANGGRQVKAVVIVAGGHITAERYARGYGIDTPLLSFSVAKSVTNALAGVLVAQGRLDMERAIGRPEWDGEGDIRSAITPNDLLRMQSGLSAVERGNGFDPVTHMLLLNDDMARYAAGRPARTRPGRTWEYTSANTIILSRHLGDIVGGGAQGMRAFAQRELFEPLGMENVIMEFDGSETFVGSTFVYASARDYARLGLLYLNDGVTQDGRRILPEGWVEYSRRRTLTSSYGAGFWLAQGEAEEARRLRELGLPQDSFYAWGALGQRIYVVPSADLVMARFGYTHSPDHDVAADMSLLRAAIMANRESVRR